MTNIKKKMKFLFKKTPVSYLHIFKKHLNIINYSLNVHLKKKYSFLVKKKKISG